MKTNFDIIAAGGGFLKNNTSVKNVDIEEVRSILRWEGFPI